MIHYIRLLRPLNLLILALTMILFRYMVVDVHMKSSAGIWEPYYLLYGFKPYLSTTGFFLLLALSLLVAAGGYVINDVMDVETDRINRGKRLIVEQHVPVEKAMLLYKILVGLSVLTSLILMVVTLQVKISGIPLMIMVFLYLYAQIFKRMALVGNIIIAVCAAMPILLITLYDLRINEFDTEVVILMTQGIGIAAGFYSLFAFLTTLIREIIKDMEDVQGDLAIEARTLPIEIGFRMSKLIVIVLQLLTGGLLSVIGFYLLAIRAEGPFYGFLVMLILPLLAQMIITLFARNSRHYAMASFAGKVHMLLGILTMLYFYSGFAPHFFNQLLNHVAVWIR